MLNRRRMLFKEQSPAASLAAKQLLISHPLFSSSERIACYLRQEDEFDCMPIIEAIWQAGKQCYLPVLSEVKKKNLEFVKFDENTRLRLNRYQISEPSHGEILDAALLDLVIVPLVAFDDCGNRVGMGGGYFDRTFAFRRGKKPFLLGLGYESQEVASIPRDNWDIVLDGVLTEKKLICFEP